MYAIEFETDVYNNTIQIPVEYKELNAKHIKVFIVEVTQCEKKLPAGFFHPVSVSSYDTLAKRDV